METANAFFREGIRHLNDGSILFSNQRYPAAVASAQKALELAAKASLQTSVLLLKLPKPLRFFHAYPAEPISPAPSHTCEAIKRRLRNAIFGTESANGTLVLLGFLQDPDDLLFRELILLDPVPSQALSAPSLRGRD